MKRGRLFIARPAGLRWMTAAAVVVLSAGQAGAHEKWFHLGPEFPLDFAAPFRPLPLSLILGVIVATALAAYAWRRRGCRDVVPGPEWFGATPAGLAAFYSVVPLVLGIHVAVPLLTNGVQGTLFSPNNELPGAWKYVLGVVQTGIALSWFYGGLARPAAVVLALLWCVGGMLLGWEPMLENLHYVGLAGFFWLAGRGPYSVDRLLFPRLEPSRRERRWALPSARTGLGLSLIVVAFTEKLANPKLAKTFLHDYPLNFMRELGVPMSDETFAMCAGAVELLVGLWILLGLFPRTIILVAWLPFNMSLTVFNWLELVGHLPFYGLLAVLLIWDARPSEQNVVVAGFEEHPLATRA